MIREEAPIDFEVTRKYIEVILETAKVEQSDLPELTILDGVVKRVYDLKYLVEDVGY